MLIVAGFRSHAVGLGGQPTRPRPDGVLSAARGLIVRLLRRLCLLAAHAEHEDARIAGATLPQTVPATDQHACQAAHARSAHSPATECLGRDAEATARLDGVHLAGRTLAHLVNNDLALTVGALDLLRAHDELPPHVHALLDEALSGLYAATHHVEQVRRITRVVTHESPAGPSLDLDRCI